MDNEWTNERSPIRCVAAPIRNASGEIVAAISVSSAVQDLSDARMNALSGDVGQAVRAISGELGWQPCKSHGDGAA